MINTKTNVIIKTNTKINTKTNVIIKTKINTKTNTKINTKKNRYVMIFLIQTGLCIKVIFMYNSCFFNYYNKCYVL